MFIENSFHKTVALFGAIGLNSVLWISLAELKAAENIPDQELALLYGGWFYDPECIITYNNCPEYTPCDEQLDKCRFCIPEIGEKCNDDESIIPDPDGCSDGKEPCDNAPWTPEPEIPSVYGYCNAGICCPEYKEHGQIYPNCSTIKRDWCDD